MPAVGRAKAKITDLSVNYDAKGNVVALQVDCRLGIGLVPSSYTIYVVMTSYTSPEGGLAAQGQTSLTMHPISYVAPSDFSLQVLQEKPDKGKYRLMAVIVGEDADKNQEQLAHRQISYKIP